MSFLLDTDTCSAFMRGNTAVFGRFVQHGGRLYVSAITIGELTAWMIRTKLPAKLKAAFEDCRETWPFWMSRLQWLQNTVKYVLTNWTTERVRHKSTFGSPAPHSLTI